MKFSLLLVVIIAFASVKHTSATCAHQPGFVYIIRENVGTTFYKVGGTTINCASRRDSIQIGNPRPLACVAEYKTNDCYNAEVAAHLAALSAPGVVAAPTNEWYIVPAANYAGFQNAVQNVANNNQEMAETKDYIQTADEV